MSDHRVSREAHRLASRLVDVPPEEWDAQLRALCPADAEVQAEARRQLEALAMDDGAPPASAVRVSVDPVASDPLVGTLVGGRYRLDLLLPYQGGMGTVYRSSLLAGNVQKPVALKVLAAHRTTSALLRRFERERRIQAQLQHPSIVTVFDVGALPDGRPFYVMEWIDGGMALDRYCDKAALDLKARLRLFQHVCDAVHYAHQQGVVHRDLKATNILVGRDGVPKLLDFGIATWLEDAGPEGRLTQSHEIVGTPTYMSPEQVIGGPVTAQSDQYSLGVVLFELLTRRSPYDVPTHSGPALLRAIEAGDIRTPSATARRSKDVTPVPVRALRGDLDQIVLRALRKEPGHRYPSVAHLREDIDCYLTHLPVAAQAPSMLYRTSRLVRRHPAASIAAVLAVSATVAAIWMLLAFNEGLSDAKRAAHVAQLAHAAVWQAESDRGLSAAQLASALRVHPPAVFPRRRLLAELAATPERLRISLRGRVGAVEVAPAGNRVAIAVGPDVTIIDVATMVTMGSTRHDADVTALSWAGDGARVATGDAAGVLRVTDVSVQQIRRWVSTPVSVADVRVAWTGRFETRVSAIQFASGGQGLIVAGGDLAVQYSGPEFVPRVLYRSNDGGWISAVDCQGTRAVAEDPGTDRPLRLIDLTTGSQLATLQRNSMPSIPGCGAHVLEATATEVSVRALADGAVVRVIPALPVAVTERGVVVYPGDNGLFLEAIDQKWSEEALAEAVGATHVRTRLEPVDWIRSDAQGRVVVWGRAGIGIEILRIGRPWGTPPRSLALQADVAPAAVEFSPDGSTLLVSGADRTRPLRIARAASSRPGVIPPVLVREQRNGRFDFEIERTRSLVDRLRLGPARESVTIWQEGGEVWIVRLGGESDSLRQIPGRLITLSPDGSLMVTASSRLTLWDTQSLLPVLDWDLGGKDVRAAAISPHLDGLVAILADNTLLWFDVPDPQVWRDIALFDDVRRTFGYRILDYGGYQRDELQALDLRNTTPSAPEEPTPPPPVSRARVAPFGDRGYDLNGDGVDETISWENLGGNNTVLVVATVMGPDVPANGRPGAERRVLRLEAELSSPPPTSGASAPFERHSAAEFRDRDGDGYREAVCVAQTHAAWEDEPQLPARLVWPRGGGSLVPDPTLDCGSPPRQGTVRLRVTAEGVTIDRIRR